MAYYDDLRNILSYRGITPADKVVLIYLMDKQGENTHCWPSLETIQRDCGLRSKQTVINSVGRLRQKKLVKIQKPSRPANGKTNRYSFNPAGLKNGPVQKVDQSKKWTGTGLKNGLEPVQNLDPNVPYNDSLTTQYINGGKHPAATESKEAEAAFENARQLYPGTKRGSSTELKDFKRYKDWMDVASLLEPAIQREMEHKSALRAAEKFCPSWKNFRTWISQRCWEQEFPEDEGQLTRECDPEVAMELERSVMT
jgi:hypothetical protein